MRLSRDDPSLLAEWWFTVDRVLLAVMLSLVAAGVVLTLAASPAIAIRKGLPAFHFVERHAVLALLAIIVMIVISTVGDQGVRRLALGIYLGALALMVAVLLIGPEINGARRWIRLGGLSLQPSEIAKPGFIVLAAWLLTEASRRPDMPGRGLAVGAYLVLAVLLALQPDIGQAALVTAMFGIMFLISGQPLKWAAALLAVAIAGAAAAYAAFPHVRQRIARFLDPASGDTFQTDRALQSFVDGGLFGRGPGEGTIKSVLPDAHTDFILAVLAEEYGAVACLALLALFAILTLRAMLRGLSDLDPFRQLAVVGLAGLIGVQALINIGVNVGLLPAKGMTLPFISSGGSSIIGVAVSAGLLLALTRRRIETARVKMPSLALG